MTATDLGLTAVVWGLPVLLALAWASAVRPPAPVPRLYWAVALAAGAWVVLTGALDTGESLLGIVVVWGVPAVAIRWGATVVAGRARAMPVRRDDADAPLRRAA